VLFRSILGTLVGGRIGYAAFYRPSLFIDFDGSFPFWGLLKINEGGMASHGGMIGLVIASIFIARRTKRPALHIIDAVCLTGPVGVVFVRCANFINGELLGRVVAQPGEPAPWWSVRYPTEFLERPMDIANPEQRERALWEIVDRNNLMLPGDSPSDALNRLLAQLRTGNAQLAEEIAPILTARHPTQLYQAFAEGVVIFIALWLVWMKPRKPGIVCAWFLVLYGIGRIITEIWRLPDAHLASARLMGLSRGQWLSAAMILVGLGLFAYIRKCAADPIGGWLNGKPWPDMNAAHEKTDAG